MQRQHQVRPPGVPDGVAVAYTEEALRAVQDIVPLHQALPPRHAEPYPYHRLHTPRRHARCPHVPDVVPRGAGGLRVAAIAAVVHACSLAQPLLGR